MKRPDISLSFIDSSGPRRHPQPDGSTYVTATPCPVCDGTIEAGEFISKVGTEDLGARWAHKDCAEKLFNAQSIRSAWVMLGADAARRPRAYKAKDLTVILEHLVQIAYRDEFEEEFGDRAGVYSTSQAEALIRAAAEGGDWPE